LAGIPVFTAGHRSDFKPSDLLSHLDFRILFVMAEAPDQLHDAPARIPAPPELVEQATALVKAFPECFWFRHPEARIRYLDDVRLVIEHLREYGGWRAWDAAQQLHRCLSPLFKKTF
jgi:hypothetical protein